MFYYSYYNGQGVSVLVYRNDDYIDNLIQKEKEFYHHMKNLTSPPLTNKDFTEKDDEGWNELTFRYMRLKTNRQHLQKLEEDTKQQLIDLCKNQSSRGNGIKAQKIVKKGNVDYSLIPELQNVDLEQYRKPISEYWKLDQY